MAKSSEERECWKWEWCLIWHDTKTKKNLPPLAAHTPNGGTLPKVGSVTLPEPAVCLTCPTRSAGLACKHQPTLLRVGPTTRRPRHASISAEVCCANGAHTMCSVSLVRTSMWCARRSGLMLHANGMWALCAHPAPVTRAVPAQLSCGCFLWGFSPPFSFSPKNRLFFKK